MMKAYRGEFNDNVVLQMSINGEKGLCTTQIKRTNMVCLGDEVGSATA
jgi:hypothetical protein